MNRKAIEAACGARIVGEEPVGGGCISSARRIRLHDARDVFVKTHPQAPTDMFPEEARGLGALAIAGAPPCPAVILATGEMLVLEWFEPGRVSANGWERFGRRLATLHRQTSERGHGFDADNYIGATRQPNRWTRDGVSFFAEQRIGYQVARARSAGLLDSKDVRLAEQVMAELPSLLPANEPPSLLHGDLWSGNIFGRRDGEATLIDPAVHYGFREADLAMAQLFGQLPAPAMAAYVNEWPLLEGAEDRVDLFNLYHVLNHLNLFGSSYLGQVRNILRRYA